MGGQGIGKSRLITEARKFQSSDIRWVEGRALSYTSKSSYWVARSILKDHLGVHQESSEEKVRDALRNRIDNSSVEEFSEIYPFLLHFLNLPLEEKYLKSVVKVLMDGAITWANTSKGYYSHWIKTRRDSLTVSKAANLLNSLARYTNQLRRVTR